MVRSVGCLSEEKCSHDDAYRVLNTMHIICILHSLYIFVVTNFLNPLVLIEKAPWSVLNLLPNNRHLMQLFHCRSLPVSARKKFFYED